MTFTKMNSPGRRPLKPNGLPKKLCKSSRHALYVYMKKITLTSVLALLSVCALPGMAVEPIRWMQTLKTAPAGVILAGGVRADTVVVRVDRAWNGSVCKAATICRRSRQSAWPC